MGHSDVPYQGLYKYFRKNRQKEEESFHSHKSPLTTCTQNLHSRAPSWTGRDPENPSQLSAAQRTWGGQSGYFANNNNDDNYSNDHSQHSRGASAMLHTVIHASHKCTHLITSATLRSGCSYQSHFTPEETFNLNRIFGASKNFKVI